MDAVCNLACDMGGMGFIENNKALCMMSVLINTHLLMAPATLVWRASSMHPPRASITPTSRHRPASRPLKEEMRIPRSPRMDTDGKAVQRADVPSLPGRFGLETRIARYHNVYGPHGTWCGGREKAPAAICRKVIEAGQSGRHSIEIWGDGRQTRSFTWIDDCLKGTVDILASDIVEPLNLGARSSSPSISSSTSSRALRVSGSNGGTTCPRQGASTDETATTRKIRALLGWETFDASSRRVGDHLPLDHSEMTRTVAADCESGRPGMLPFVTCPSASLSISTASSPTWKRNWSASPESCSAKR